MNEGNSGGPVFNKEGKLMGIIFQGQGQNTNYMIVSFYNIYYLLLLIYYY